MSKSTGLSIDTLKLIQVAEKKTNQARAANQKIMDDQSDKRRYQQFTSLANQIRQVMLLKQMKTIVMDDLLDQLHDKQQGSFNSKSKNPISCILNIIVQ